ncbi:MAG: aminopeptidase P N-terminal domain-containing protein [Nitrosomonadales bacterium]
MNFNNNIYLTRRKQLAKSMREGVAIISNGSESIRNNDVHYKFRENSYFYYLTGFNEPEAIVLIFAKPFRSVIFVKEKNPLKETWEGYLYGPKKAKEIFLFDDAFGINSFDKYLTQALGDQKQVFCLEEQESLLLQITQVFKKIQKSRRHGGILPEQIKVLNKYLDPLRLIKKTEEISIIRKACQISAESHVQAMKKVRPGLNEYHIESELLYGFSQRGASNVAYPSIVASGSNACTLHYNENNKPLKTGDLILIDAGCEYENYASDITRTYPISGKFSPEQKAVYEVVLEAQKKAIEAARKNQSFNEPHNVAIKILAEGLKDLGILKNSIDSIIEKKEYEQFYMHRTSHWMGLDVHDVGDYYSKNQQPVKLENGNIITIEPGLYFSKKSKVPLHFRGIGIRIEDDVLINNSNPEVLTRQCPKEIKELENIIGSD